MPKLNFDPKRHGYHFTNAFETRVLPGILNNVSTLGLCGGMAMSVLDYWRAGIPVPLHEAEDLGPTALPSEASRLRQYIFDRQMNSLLTSLMFTRWVVAPWIGPNDFHNWATGSEFEAVKSQLALGRPTLLGLWSMTPGNATSGHQVVCYGFEDNPKQLYIYDPNFPNEESILRAISPAEGCESRGAQTNQTSMYRGYFFTDVYNWNENPPYDPRYKDLVVTSGLSISPENLSNPIIGRALTCSVTVANIGEYPSRFKNLFIWVRDPSGANVDPLLGGAEPGITVLQPGESKTIARTSNNFGTNPGTYRIGVSYLSIHDHWINIPPVGVGFQTSATIALWRQKALITDQWFDVNESDRADRDTDITIQPGDEFQLDGTGSIWAGVWFTGLNGPEGWVNRIETNPGSPMNNRSDAHPFSLVSRFEGQPYFFVGNGLSRRAFSLGTPARLMLRINDNTPGNGSGAFRCRVRVWR